MEKKQGKHPGGRPPLFKKKEEILKKFEEYKLALKNPDSEWYEDIPDVESFCDFVGAWRQLFQEYEKKPEFSTTIKSIKNFMYRQKKKLAMINKMNPAVFIFDAKNNHDYSDKVENYNVNKNLNIDVEKLSDEELENLLSQG